MVNNNLSSAEMEQDAQEDLDKKRAKLKEIEKEAEELAKREADVAHEIKELEEKIRRDQFQSLPPELQQLMNRCNEQQLTKQRECFIMGGNVTRTYCTLCNMMPNKHSDECEKRCSVIKDGRSLSNLLEIAKKSDADQAEFITRVEGALRG